MEFIFKYDNERLKFEKYLSISNGNVMMLICTYNCGIPIEICNIHMYSIIIITTRIYLPQRKNAI